MRHLWLGLLLVCAMGVGAQDDPKERKLHENAELLRQIPPATRPILAVPVDGEDCDTFSIPPLEEQALGPLRLQPPSTPLGVR